MCQNIYLHAPQIADLQAEIDVEKEKLDIVRAKQAINTNTKKDQQVQEDKKLKMKDFNEITYLEDYQKDINFSFLQSLVLIAAYICGLNKESQDIRMFEARNETKRRAATNKKKETDKSQPNMLGKSKRFNLERFTAVLDYLMSIYAEKATEN